MQPQITTGDIINCIEQAAPLHWQEDYDNAGLIVGNRKNICTGVLVCLDVCPSTLNEALSLNCNLIISHHPFIFRPVKKIVYNSPTEKILSSAIKNDISIYASHTNIDSSSMGVNYMLAEKLGLKSLQPIDNGKYAAEENYLGEGAIGYTDNEIPAEEFLIKLKSALKL
ncbi:MAG: Nif3-like dinuclear metal center hexameric protein, partial [Bacteroidales bacterium]|nr:Nif3-like dinuclear metal center hexameric protein [Bacteroidales bacterium]